MESGRAGLPRSMGSLVQSEPGAVGAEEFHRLSEGQHPHTSEQLVQHRQSFEYRMPMGKRSNR